MLSCRHTTDTTAPQSNSFFLFNFYFLLLTPQNSIVIVTFVCILIIAQYNLINGQPVGSGDKTSKNNINMKRPIGVRRSTKSPATNEFMPMASMQMINRNAMMHNKFGSRQVMKATKLPMVTTLNPCVTAHSETSTKGVRPNTIFTSYNWLPSR